MPLYQYPPCVTAESHAVCVKLSGSHGSIGRGREQAVALIAAAMTGTSDKGTAELLRVVGIRKGRLGVPTVGQTNVHRPYEKRTRKLQPCVILGAAKDLGHRG